MDGFEGVRANTDKTAGEIFNVGGGLENSISLLELIDEIEKLTGKRLAYQLRPMRPGDQPVYVTDYSKLNQVIGWRPQFTVRQTLETIYEWWMKNRKIFADTPRTLPIASPVVQRVPEAEAAS